LHFFCTSGSSGYNGHDSLDHSYITIGYLDVDVKNSVYSNLRTPINNVCLVTCIHTTLAVNAEGKREETTEGCSRCPR
jgi:hypothetical protein